MSLNLISILSNSPPPINPPLITKWHIPVIINDTGIILCKVSVLIKNNLVLCKDLENKGIITMFYIKFTVDGGWVLWMV